MATYTINNMQDLIAWSNICRAAPTYMLDLVHLQADIDAYRTHPDNVTETYDANTYYPPGSWVKHVGYVFYKTSTAPKGTTPASGPDWTYCWPYADGWIGCIDSPYAAFSGTFYGNDHVIDNLYFAGTYYGTVYRRGFISLCKKGARIQDLRLRNLITDTICLTGGILGGLDGWSTSYHAVIDNCSVAGAMVVGAGGMIVGDGHYKATISNCHSSGSMLATSSAAGSGIGGIIGNLDSVSSSYLVTVTNCYSTANVTSESTQTYDKAGGIAGTVDGTDGVIAYCWATGDIEGNKCIGGIAGAGHCQITQCWASGNVTGVDRVGGIVGVANGANVDISDCFAFGNVESTDGYRIGSFAGFSNAGAFYRCYGKGELTIGEVVEDEYGGFLGGASNDPTVTSCFYDSTTTGQADNDGRGTPKTTVMMKQAATFSDWSFIDVWRIDPQQNDGYPFLQAFDVILPDRRGEPRRRYSTHTERRYA